MTQEPRRTLQIPTSGIQLIPVQAGFPSLRWISKPEQPLTLDPDLRDAILSANVIEDVAIAENIARILGSSKQEAALVSMKHEGFQELLDANNHAPLVKAVLGLDPHIFNYRENGRDTVAVSTHAPAYSEGKDEQASVNQVTEMLQTPSKPAIDVETVTPPQDTNTSPIKLLQASSPPLVSATSLSKRSGIQTSASRKLQTPKSRKSVTQTDSERATMENDPPNPERLDFVFRSFQSKVQALLSRNSIKIEQGVATTKLSKDLQEISRDLEQIVSAEALQKIPEALVSHLLRRLDAYLSDFMNHENIHEFEKGQSDFNFCALEVNILLLAIMGAPGLPKSLYITEILDNLFSFMENIVRREYLKILNEKGRSNTEQSAGRLCRTMTDRLSQLMQALNSLCGNQTIDDSHMIQVVSLILDMLVLKGSEDLRHHLTTTIHTIFCHYPNHRHYIVDDFIERALGPSTERRLRCHRIDGSDSSVHFHSAFLVAMVQACSLGKDAPQESNPIQNAPSCAYYAAECILVRMARKSNLDADYTNTVRSLIEDLTMLATFPDWVGAETILVAIMQRLLNIIQASDSEETGSRPPKHFAIDVLGSLLAGIRRLQIGINETLKGHDGLISRFSGGGELSSALLAFLRDRARQDARYDSAYKVLSDMTPLRDVPGQQFEQRCDGLSVEASRITHKALMVKRNLLCSFESGFTVLGALLNHKQLKSKAMKAVSIVVDADPAVLADDGIMTALIGYTTDERVAVRENAMDMIGKCVARHSSLLSRYGPSLVDRLKDKSLKVRRLAVSLLGTICIDSEDRPMVEAICVRMMERLDDQDASIREAVSFQLRECMVGSAIDRFSTSPNWKKFLLYKSFLFCRISASALRDKSTTDAFMKLLHPLQDRAKEGKQDTAHFFEAFVQCIIDQMVVCEKESGDQKKVHEEINSFLCGLVILSRLEQRYVGVHIQTLAHYLDPEISDTRNLKLVVELFEAINEDGRQNSSDFTLGIEARLVKLFKTQLPEVVGACAKTLCIYASKGIGTKPSKVAELYKNLLAFLQAQLQVSGKETFKSRALFSIGVLCLHHELTESQDRDPYKGVYELAREYIQQADKLVSISALQCMGQIWIRRPQYVLESLDLLSPFLEASADSKQIIQALRTISEYLTFEEERSQMISGEGKDAKAQTLSIWRVEESMGVGIAQRLSGSIFRHAFHSSVDVRKSFLFVVRIMLRQGLIVPTTCVSCLVALMGDCDESMRALSNQLLEFVFSKSHSALRIPLIMEGLRQAFSQERRISTSSTNDGDFLGATNVIQNRERFCYQPLYELAGKVSAVRQQLVSGMIAGVSEGFEVSDSSRQTTPSFGEYLLNILSHLHYGTESEVLSVIQQAHAITSVESSQLLDKSKENDKSPSLRARIFRLVGLVLLKQHLKVVYGLNTEKHGLSSQFEDKKAAIPVSRVSAAVWNPDLAHEVTNTCDPAQRYRLLKRILERDTEGGSTLSPGSMLLRHQSPARADEMPTDVATSKTPKRRSQTPRKTPQKRSRSTPTRATTDPAGGKDVRSEVETGGDANSDQP